MVFSWGLGLKEMSGHIEQSGDFLKDFLSLTFWVFGACQDQLVPAFLYTSPLAMTWRLPGGEEGGQRNQTALGRGTENPSCPLWLSPHPRAQGHCVAERHLSLCCARGQVSLRCHSSPSTPPSLPWGQRGIGSWGTAVAASRRMQTGLNRAPSWQQSTGNSRTRSHPQGSPWAAASPWHNIPLLPLSKHQRWQRAGSAAHVGRLLPGKRHQIKY